MNNSPDKTCADSIVLFAKQSGPTSFSSLNVIKHALNTKKVGHTGTLDSFAQGLLVVCTGRLTKLAANITEFDKSYKAVIKFGEETDTLEYTGTVIKTAPLPDLQTLKKAVSKFIGEQLQIPPDFSAIHINGKRASDLSRLGKEIKLPARKINVYSADLVDYKLNEAGLVEYCLINFSVSKGTYIRSLARDISKECNSAGHLAGLYRTKVGNFRIEEAAGYDLLPEFSIDCVIANTKKEDFFKQQEIFLKNNDENLKNQVICSKKKFTEETSRLCGFLPVHTPDDLFAAAFKNGKIISKSFFKENLTKNTCKLLAVFNENDFIGLVEQVSEDKFSYKFVIN